MLHKYCDQYYALYRNRDLPLTTRFQSWWIHKALLIASAIINTVLLPICLLVLTFGICVIGTLKIGVFLVTLGNIRLRIKTGASESLQFLFALIVSYIMIATQLFIDIFWVLSCLPLRRLLAKMKAIFVTLLLPLRRLLKALLIPLQHIAARFMRVLKAESSACCCEKQSRFSLFVGKRIKKFQTDWNKEQDRPLKLIAFQFLDTIWLIPTCIVLACLQIVFVLFAAIWLAIRILFSICFDHLLSRNSKLMSFIPTGIGYLLLGSHCLFLLAKDALALIYKLFRCLNVFKAAASVKEFLMYIPKAIFEK